MSCHHCSDELYAPLRIVLSALLRSAHQTHLPKIVRKIHFFIVDRAELTKRWKIRVEITSRSIRQVIGRNIEARGDTDDRTDEKLA